MQNLLNKYNNMKRIYKYKDSLFIHNDVTKTLKFVYDLLLNESRSEFIRDFDIDDYERLSAQEISDTLTKLS